MKVTDFEDNTLTYKSKSKDSELTSQHPGPSRINTKSKFETSETRLGLNKAKMFKPI